MRVHSSRRSSMMRIYGILVIIIVLGMPGPGTPCASSISKRASRPVRPPPTPAPVSVPVTPPEEPRSLPNSGSATTPPPTPRSNVTFPTYKCPAPYSEYYCLNEAKCFTIIIQDSPLYNCECRDGFVGQRCEYKDLDGSYLLSRSRLLLETASIASGASVALLLVALIGAALWARARRSPKMLDVSGEAPPPPRLRPTLLVAPT